MPLFLENFDLGFLEENEETFGGLARHVAQNGTAIVGYYGLPYFNLDYGDVQMIFRTERHDNGTALAFAGLDSHAGGQAVWEVRLKAAQLDRKDAGLLAKRVMVTKADGSGGMAVVSLVNADVLPSFLVDDLIQMQVVAFPELIQYFEDEDAYADNQPSLRNGGKFLLSDGCVFPSGLLRNRNPDSSEFESNEHLDDITNIRGTVKALYRGEFVLNGEAGGTFLRCAIGTEFGPLEIIHTIAQVDETQRKNIRVGAIVNFYGTISGDVAIHEYEKGLVRDEVHDLASLRYVFSGGDPERLRSILAKDAVYFAEYNKTSYTGPDEIIARLKFVQGDHAETYYTHMASISSIDEGGEPLTYGVGKRCVILASGEETNYESIALIDVDRDGNISRIVTSVDPRYHFSVDEKPKYKTPLDDVEPAESVVIPILARARFHGVIDAAITDEMVCKDSSHAREFEQNVRQMLEAMPQDEAVDREKQLANMYGYLFAKAVEMEYAQNQSDATFRSHLICSYTPADAWAGRIRSALEAEQHKKLEDAFDLGRQFYKDFEFFQASLGDDETYDGDLLKSLMVVQNLGRLYSRKCLNW